MKKIFTQTFFLSILRINLEILFNLTADILYKRKTFMKHKLNHNNKEKFNCMWQPLEKDTMGT